MNIFKKIFRQLDYTRKKLLAPGKLRRDRAYFEKIQHSNDPATCKTAQEMMDEMLHLIRTRRVLPYRDLLRDYIESGLFRKGTNPADYLFMGEWFAALAPIEERLTPEDFALTDDKLQQAKLFRENGIRMPINHGILELRNGKAVIEPLDDSGSAVPLMDALRQHHLLFCKPIVGCQGDGCLFIEEAPGKEALIINGEEKNLTIFEEELQAKDSSPHLLVQEVVQQHNELASFHAASLNTLRLWSVWLEDGPQYFRGILRMGRGGAHVDNAHQGGFIVDILEDGTLSTHGCVFSPFNVKPFTEHPDSHIPFSGVKLPYFDEAKELISKAHRLFPREMFALGWDVAITPDGPLIVEVNSYPGIPAMQRLADSGWYGEFKKTLLPAIKAIQKG